jgi:pimeloyl-ACP methyl ester carboxylesterase
MTDREYLVMEISTTVRSFKISPLSRFVRAGHRLFSALVPEAAAARAERLFLTPPRPRRPAWEVELLARAQARPMRVGARRIETWTWGTGPSVLLVHGWGGRGTQLGAYVAPLVARGFSVVTFDAPGHGASDEGVVTIPEMTAAIHTVAGSRGPLAGLVAHSVGALTATAALHEGLNADAVVFVARRPSSSPPPPSSPRPSGSRGRYASACASGSRRGLVDPGRPST